jgi:hypothetical protein
MRRRDFIGVLSGAAIALPLAAQAQQVIGIARSRRPTLRGVAVGPHSPIGYTFLDDRRASRALCMA